MLISTGKLGQKQKKGIITDTKSKTINTAENVTSEFETLNYVSVNMTVFVK